MAQTVVAMFKYQEGVEAAVNELRALNYDPSDFSIVMKDIREAQDIQTNTGVNVAEGTTSGALFGGVLAGIAGLLIGLGVLTIPGIGPLLVAGPVASALGLTGAAATATTAAVTGAVAGGLIGALVSLGFPEDRARQYEEHIQAGGIALFVPTRDRLADEVREILARHGATDIHQMDLHTNTQEFV